MSSIHRLKQFGSKILPFVITSGGQIIIQTFGFLGGILIVRNLTTSEYAIYTLANTVLSTMIMLTDGGISAGVLSEGGQVWNQPSNLGKVIVSGIALRRRFALFSVTITMPIFYFLLHYHQISLISTALVMVSIIPVFYLTLSGAFYEISLKLNQDFLPIQKIQFYTTIQRLLVQFAIVFSFPLSYLILMGNGIAQFISTRNLRNRAKTFAELNQSSDKEIENKMLKIVKRTLPGTIYFCFSGQIMIWLVSIFGSTTNIAQLGALGRYSMIFNLFNSVFAIVVLSKFSKLPFQSKLIFRSFISILAGLFLFSTLILGFVWIFSTQLLFLIGSKYSMLSYELFLSILSGALGLIASSTYSLFTVKGWAINPLIFIPISMLSIITGVYFMDISTLAGVLYMNIFVSLVQIIMYVGYGMFKINEMRKYEFKG